MNWLSSIVIAVLIAMAVTLLVVALLGWRRPGAPQSESAIISASFFFVILFLTTWAAGMWLVPWGPVSWGVAWLGWMGVALVVVLLLGVASQEPDRWRRRNAEPVPATEGELAAVGFGVVFWVLLVVLLALALAGSVRVDAP